MRELPYGEWPSPISAADLARSGVGLGFVDATGDEVWWGETRPSEDGRTTVVRRRSDGTVADVLPAPWHARSRVHEYGGRDWLPLPESRDRYEERSPLSHVDRLSCPVLLLQGSDDRVVPPSQSLMVLDALVAKGLRHAYLEFDGEQHGFRKESTIVAAHEAELSFYGQVFGFEPTGVSTLPLRTGSDESGSKPA